MGLLNSSSASSKQAAMVICGEKWLPLNDDVRGNDKDKDARDSGGQKIQMSKTWFVSREWNGLNLNECHGDRNAICALT